MTQGSGDPPPASRTSWGRALGASAVWSGLLIVLISSRQPPSELLGTFAALAVTTALLASWGTWLFTRRHAPHFAVLVVIALPIWIVAFVIVDNILAQT